VVPAKSFPRNKLTKPLVGKKEMNLTPETQKSKTAGIAIAVVGFAPKL
jgi:hypothetical protein